MSPQVVCNVMDMFAFSSLCCDFDLLRSGSRDNFPLVLVGPENQKNKHAILCRHITYHELDEFSLSGGQGEHHKFSSSIIDAEQPQTQSVAV